MGSDMGKAVEVSVAERRREVPKNRRESVRQKLTILSKPKRTTLYVQVSFYEDGRVCEVFLDVKNCSANELALYQAMGLTVSIALQYGVPLQRIVDNYLGFRCSPSGPVINHPRIKNCQSVLDLVARHLAIEFLGRDDLAHVEKNAGPAHQRPTPATESETD